MEQRNIRVLIADDHTLFRTGLKSLLEQIKNVELVGEAVNGQDLVRQTMDLLPDIVLTDIWMPVMDGFTAVKELLRRKLCNRIIALSAHGREEPVLKMLEAGALGYLLKSADTEEIAEAIQTVYRHKPYFCKEISEKLTEIVSTNYQLSPEPSLCFTDREQEIMRMICRECTSKEIAYSLNISKRTVEGHRTRIMDKIGARSIAGIITYSVEKRIYQH